MNKNNILKKLNWKHNDFVNSIEDEDVRELVRNNSIVTGGAITSLLQDEYPNDFDYYFTDLETTKKVAQYYVKQFIKDNPLSKDPKGKMSVPIVEVDEDRVRIHIKSSGVIGENTDGQNYEYFESRPEEDGQEFIVQAVQEISEADEIPANCLDEEDKKKYRPLFLTDNAITLSDKVQLVIRFYGEAKQIHTNFDFVHCCNYWIPHSNKLVLKKNALVSILTKELKYIGSKYPLCSIVRLRKFIKRGWTINAGEILKICFQLSELDLTRVEVLEDQLVGVDTAYFKQLIDLLKSRQEEDKDFKPTQAYLSTLVDRIFGK